jgi:serine/threonine-protein kinase
MDDKEAAESELGKAYGTPYYISPEQIRGDRDIDFRADIYSLGATLYHLVTGRPPFDGETPTAVMHKHLKQPLVPVDHINTELSAGLGEVIDLAMAKNRDERYHSTRDMLEDLLAIGQHGAPTHARRNMDVDSLAKIEESGTTVDIIEPPPPPADVWSQPAVIGVMVFGGLSLIANAILIALLLAR